MVERLRFASGTPYESEVFEPPMAASGGETRARAGGRARDPAGAQ